MTIREYLEVIPDGPAYYKDCKIVAIDKISERYALIEVQLPLPLGGYLKEIASLDEVVEGKVRL